MDLSRECGSAELGQEDVPSQFSFRIGPVQWAAIGGNPSTTADVMAIDART
jgi:hypothetical protein